MAKVAVCVQTRYKEAYEALKIINRSRRAAGVKPLCMDKTLLSNAWTRARECSVYYAHTRPDGRAWHTAISKKYICAGENIGFGFNEAGAVTRAWMRSSSHRKNILNGRYTCVGIACVSVDGVTYWAQEFADGRAKSVSRPPDKKKNVKIPVAGRFLSVSQKRVDLLMHKGESGTASLVLDNAGYGDLTVRVAACGVRYYSSDKSVVAVTAGGRIRAVGAGRASIKAELAGNGRICRRYRITVRE